MKSQSIHIMKGGAPTGDDDKNSIRLHLSHSQILLDGAVIWATLFCYLLSFVIYMESQGVVQIISLILGTVFGFIIVCLMFRGLHYGELRKKANEKLRTKGHRQARFGGLGQ